MSQGISIRTAGQERLGRFLSCLRNADVHEVLESIGALVVSQTQERIVREKAAPDGTAWPDLDPNYAARKKKGSLLELEGDLRDSIVAAVSGEQVEVGTNLIYAATHQFGDADRKIPQREFLGLSNDNLDAVERVLADFLNDLVRSS